VLPLHLNGQQNLFGACLSFHAYDSCAFSGREVLQGEGWQCTPT
jgi:hypothetical protein